ncbi:hypothetical protein LVY74_09165 [Acinetobacter sp. ME22]|uniref:hypothetical protein n=1 Tax=Acinetobacter sp. ME22 TaxID=2904802 RepID=UPI001EDA458C|nr:hypothetical protein [Acinetobacter sp. ME22]MCG2573728.1 hypothetical protein [Acinetobacter sp. ME22]
METQAQVGMLTISIRSVGLTAHKNKKSKNKKLQRTKAQTKYRLGFCIFFQYSEKRQSTHAFFAIV